MAQALCMNRDSMDLSEMRKKKKMLDATISLVDHI